MIARDGTVVTVNTSSGYPTYEDSNGNLDNSAGLDTMGRSVAAGLTGTSTDLGGCDAADTSAMLYTFPGPNGSASDTSRLLKLCSLVENLSTAFGSVYFDDSTSNSQLIQESGAQSHSVIAKAILYNAAQGWSASPSWSFQYNNGNAGGQNSNGTLIPNFGDLTKVTFPEGGSISYVWKTLAPCESGLVTPVSRWVSQRTLDAANGSPLQQSYYSYSPDVGIVTDAEGNTVTHKYTYPLATNSTPCTSEDVETSTTWTDSSGHTLKALKMEYAAQQGPAQLQYMPIGVRKTAETTTLNDGTTLRVEYDYDTALSVGSFSGLSYGLLTQKRELAAGAGTGTTPLRCTSYSYAALSNANYLNANEMDLPTSESVYSGSCSSGTLVAQTTYGYDESGVQSSGISSTGYLAASGPWGAYRGNRTSTRKAQLNPSGSAITNSTVYYDTGLPYSETDPKGNPPTTHLYDAAYVGAYRTKTTMPTTNGIAHVVSASYDFNTGKVTGFTDQNSQSSSYTYDALGRIWTAHFPDNTSGTGISKSFCYPTLTAITTVVALTAPLASTSNSTVCPAISGNAGHAMMSNYDGLGRVVSVIDLGANSEVDTTYDDLGRLHSLSNPYAVGGSTSGSVIHGYDGLNRPTSVTNQDGTTKQTWIYSGLTTTFTDESTTSSWKRTNDALGRLSQVVEPGSLSTIYGYDVLDNLTSVNQQGVSGETPRTRGFTYDSVSRLLTSNNPETGPICYGTWSGGSVGSGACQAGYDLNGNLLAKTDARNATTSFTYDALNRVLTKKAPAVATVPAFNYTYGYDAVNPPVANGIGRLLYTTNGAGEAEQYWYDAMGRMNAKTTYLPSTPSTPRSISVVYDLAGNTSSFTYPDGRTITHHLDGAGRISSIVYSSWNGTPQTATYLSVPTTNGYDPAGHLINATMSNGVSLSASYDVRQRIGSLSYQNSSGLLWKKQYAWTASSNLQNWTDGITGGQRRFQYDNLNRVVLAQDFTDSAQPGALSTNGLNQTYTYDSFGDLQSNGSFSSSFPTQNKMSGYSYDLSGNLMSNGATTMAWDAESKLYAASGETNVYGATGDRIEKQGTAITDTVYFGERPMARLSSSAWTDLIYGPNGLLAEVPGTQTATPTYRLIDHLGTEVGTTGSNALLTNPVDFTPFGQKFAGSTSDPFQFTGKERDAESGLDYFGARYYSSNMGRWMSPDWADKPEAVPYSDLENPQSLNLYNYVNNNPLSKADKDGHCLEDVCVVEGAAAVTAVALTAYVYLSMPSTQRSLTAAGSQAISTISSWFHKSDSNPAPSNPADSKPQEPTSSAGGETAGERFKPGDRAADAGKKCVYCGRQTTEEPGKDNSRETDHGQPRSRDGNREPENRNPSCRTCNRQKGNKTPEEFKKWQDKNPDKVPKAFLILPHWSDEERWLPVAA